MSDGSQRIEGLLAHGCAVFVLMLFFCGLAWIGASKVGLALQIPLLLAVLALGGGLCASVWLNRVNIATCYENGITHTSRSGERSILFADVIEFSYFAEMRSINGTYTGTVKKLWFLDCEGREISFTRVAMDPEGKVASLRDHVARRLAERDLEQYKSKGVFQWLDGVRFIRDGLEITSKGLFRGEQVTVIPFQAIRCEIEAGVCYLSHLRNKPVYRTATSVPNFFPGLALLRMLEPPTSLKRLPTHEAESGPFTTEPTGWLDEPTPASASPVLRPSPAPSKPSGLVWRMTGVQAESGRPGITEVVADSEEEATALAILNGFEVHSVERVN